MTDKTQAIAMGVIVEQLIKKLSSTVDNFAKGLCMIANIVDKHQKNSILQITPTDFPSSSDKLVFDSLISVVKSASNAPSPLPNGVLFFDINIYILFFGSQF